jgi:hypothetical protein
MEYYVIGIEKCEECEGAGVTRNPQWIEFGVWLVSKGYDDSVKEMDNLLLEYFGVADRRDVPPKEVFCPECEGTGEIEKRVELRKALTELRNALKDSKRDVQS